VCLQHRDDELGPSRTRKPRRDRIRRGAGSGTREVQGPRACDCRYDGGCPDRGCAPPKPGALPGILASRVNPPGAKTRGDSLAAQTNGNARSGAFVATATLRDRDGFGGSSSRSLRETRCGGSAPTTEGSSNAEPNVGDGRPAAFGPQWSHGAVASREARGSGVHRGLFDRSGRRSNRHAPFASSLSRANGGRRTRDPETRFGDARARLLLREGPRRGGLRWWRSGAAVLENEVSSRLAADKWLRRRRPRVTGGRLRYFVAAR
jgi:hypothetical protein